MTKRILIGALALVLGLSPAVAQLERGAGQRSSTTRTRPALPEAPGGGGEFGERVAGTFLGELFLEGSPAFFEFVITLHADGTLVASDAGDFLFGLESPSFGVWRQNGPRGLTLRLLYFSYDSIGNIILVGRDTAVAEFDDDLSTASGKYTGEALVPIEVLLWLDPSGGQALLSDVSSFRMTRLEPDVPWGPEDGDDDPKSATVISCPSFVSKNTAIETFDDRDFYLLSGPPGQTVAIDIDAQLSGSNLDTILGAFDGGLSIIAGSDDDPAPGEPFLFDSYLTVDLPASGSLLVAVAPYRIPFSFDGHGYSIGTYTLSVECGTEVATRSGVDRSDLAHLDRATISEPKPYGVFPETLRIDPQHGTSGANRRWSGTYLVAETGFFGEVRDLVTLHEDGTFALHFEGGMTFGSAAVRGSCEPIGPQRLACEGLDLLHGFLGFVFAHDRISWVFDLGEVPGLASGVQVTQELFNRNDTGNPPRPNLGVDGEELVGFGIGSDLPVMRRIEVPVENEKTSEFAVDAEFASRVAGSYLGRIGIADFFLATLNADGTFVASSLSDFRFAELNSPLQGAWVRTGPSQITIRALGFDSDEELARRVTLLTKFDREFIRAGGTATEEIFLREQILDPVDPNTDEDPPYVVTGGFEMRAIVVPATDLDDRTGGGAAPVERLEDESSRPGNRTLER